MYLLGKEPAWMAATFLKGAQKVNSAVSENSSHTLQAKIQIFCIFIEPASQNIEVYNPIF